MPHKRSTTKNDKSTATPVKVLITMIELFTGLDAVGQAKVIAYADNLMRGDG